MNTAFAYFRNNKARSFTNLVAAMTFRKMAAAKAHAMALHDELTGLPNRYLMREYLVKALANKKDQSVYSAMLMLDMDHFKEVNAMLGHAMGDELLIQTTQRLSKAVRQVDTVGRFGGDEFAIIVEGISSSLDCAMENAGNVCQSILKALAKPYHLNNQQLEVTPSIGVVLFNSDKDEPDELIKQADIALYKAKASGRNQVCFFQPSLQEDALEKAMIIRDLRKALDNNEMSLFYQPIVDARQNTMGVEALIRWHHPIQGMIPPDKFIPLAEKSGLILPIGEWVLRTACRQQALWRLDPQRNKWIVSINMSARQLAKIDFVDQVANTIADTGANAHCISFEITEDVLQENIESTIEKMNALRQQGVRFSLDDFGTGYSSLSYLKRLPIDHLKIDKSFIDDLLEDSCDADIARTIIVLAKSLEVGVVAEGVETKAQFDWLLENACTYYQGYLFSRPVPQSELVMTKELS